MVTNPLTSRGTLKVRAYATSWSGTGSEPER
jgi:hypothetical protein